ncbi:MAG: hypothetical protein ABIP95_11465 [Pelobium sp.]
MKKLLLFLILFPFSLKAQDLTGLWKGDIYQDIGGYSPLYSLEINIKQENNKITGYSHAYLGSIIVEDVLFKGYIDKDSIYLSEYESGILKSVQPIDYVLCIKNFVLAYAQKQSNEETLTGRWNGIGYDEDKKDGLTPNDCIPGLVLLKRMTNVYKESEIITNPKLFPDSISNTKIVLFEEIEVAHQIVQISISDYEKVDGDKVTILLNREVVADHVSVKRNPETFNLALSPINFHNELLIKANNLGRIPPNTSLIIIKDGDKIHKVYLSSDFKSTGAIYLNYKKK